jgi:hypothetical protein
MHIYIWKCHKDILLYILTNKNVTRILLVYLKQKCHFFFYKLENQRAEQFLPGWVGTSGRREDMGKGCRRVNMAQMYTCVQVYTYINGKMIHVETVPGMGWMIKENGGGGEFKYDIFDIS